MKTLIPEEYQYLRKLQERNSWWFIEERDGLRQEEETNPYDPLENPMSTEEEKLRASIKTKMTLFAKELAYSCHCCMLPEAEFVNEGILSLESLVLFFKGIWWLDDIEKRGDIEEIIGTKYVGYSSVYEFGSAGKVISKMAADLRERIRIKNPEEYDRITQEREANRARI